MKKSRNNIVTMTVATLVALLLPLSVFLIVPFQVLVNGTLYYSQAIFGSIPISLGYFFDVMVVRTIIELGGYVAFIHGNILHTIVVMITMFGTWLVVGMILHDMKKSSILAGLLAVGSIIVLGLAVLVQFILGTVSIHVTFLLEVSATLFDVWFWIGLIMFYCVAMLGSFISMILIKKSIA